MKNNNQFVEQLYNSFLLAENNREIKNSKNFEEDVRKLCYEKYVVKPEDVRSNYSAVIIREQQDGLDKWFDYLKSRSSHNIPTWIRLFVFKFAMESNGKKKTDPFVRLDPEVLNKCMSTINGRIGRSLFDTDMKRLKEFFMGMYLRELNEKEREDAKKTDGVWIKFDSGGEDAFKTTSQYNKIHEAIKGYNTGWQIQMINDWDFYVYFTKDDNDKYKIPRIIIGTDDNYIKYVRGKGEGGNVEENLNDIFEKKLDEVPGGGYYKKQLHDDRLLDKLDKEHKYRKLTKEELAFLYEINRYINTFTYSRDERIDRIKRGRNKKEDLAEVFNCLPSQIGTEKEDLYRTQLVYYDKSNIYLNMYRKMEEQGFHLPKYVRHGVILPYIRSAKDLILPEYVGGTIALPHLASAKGLVLPKEADYVYFSDLRNGEGLVLPDYATAVDIRNLYSLLGVTFPKCCYRIYYHGECYSLEEIIELQKEEERTYDPNAPRREKKYGKIPNEYYRNG